MRLIKADYDRTVELEGVTDPVHRPVDIDQSQTGFASLRSLRIYCFTVGSLIDGHAENDEVLIVVLAGSVQLTMSEHELESASPKFELSYVGNADGASCVAYLPPGGSYRLRPTSDAEVAYARAIPTRSRTPTVFSAKTRLDDTGRLVLFEEEEYAERLRLRMVRVSATASGFAGSLLKHTESACESLLHVRTLTVDAGELTMAGQGDSIVLNLSDTVVLMPGEPSALCVAAGLSATLLVVVA